MYADDKILLSASVTGLQKMLTRCAETSAQLLLDFNCSKSKCIAIGPASKYKINEMTLGNDTVSWCNRFKYLGISFIADRKSPVDIDVMMLLSVNSLSLVIVF